MVLRNGKEIGPGDPTGDDDSITPERENELLQDETPHQSTQPPQKPNSSELTVSADQLDDLIKNRLLSLLGLGNGTLPATASAIENRSETPSVSSEQKQWTAWDAAYPTPTFSVRKFGEEERLVGHRNFKPWKKMVELDLAALNLTPFIKDEAGESIKLSPSRRKMLDAQTLQYLKASVTKQVIGHLQNVHSAYAAFKMICKMFENVRALDQVQLHRKFGRLRFKAGFNAVRFCADFDHIVEEYKVMGVNFPDSYLATIFLEKIDGIFDPTSQYFSFFTTITALPPEIQTLSYIKSRFLAVDNMSFTGNNLSDNNPCTDGNISMSENFTGAENCSIDDNFVCAKPVRVCFIGEKRKATEKENVPPKKFKQSYASTSSVNSNVQKSGQNKSATKSSAHPKYTPEQIAKLRTMSVDEKNKIRCHNCGEYFHQGKDCKNPGRLCYVCFEYGHEKKDCPNPKKTGMNNLEFDSSEFNKSVCVLIDSGATHHVTNKKEYLCDFKMLASPMSVKTASKNGELFSYGEGSLKMVILFEKSKSLLILKNVQFVPEITETIISVNKFNLQFQSSFTLNANSGFLFSRKMKKKLSLVFLSNNLYFMEIRIKSSEAESTTSEYSSNSIVAPKLSESEPIVASVKVGKNKKVRKTLTESEISKLESEGELWHRRMGHISPSYLHKLKYVSDGITNLICKDNFKCCTVCSKSKSVRKPFNKDRERATRPCEILHVDLMGPISPCTFVDKNKFVLCVIDDYTKYLQVFTMKTKCQTLTCMKQALIVLQSQFPGQGNFKKMRCDNGTEFTSTAMQNLLEPYGINLEEAEPYTHEHNGTVERLNRTIQERTRALICESGFPTNMWGLALHAATWLYNRTPHSSLNFQTPFEKYFNKIPDMSQIRVFGCVGEVLDETIPKGQKFKVRTKTLYLVGFRSTGYIMFDPKSNKTINTCNVKFDESKLYGNEFSRNIDDEELMFEPVVETKIDETSENSDHVLHVLEKPEIVSSILNKSENEVINSGKIENNMSDESISEITLEIDDDWDDSENVSSKSQVSRVCAMKGHSNKFTDYESIVHSFNNEPLTYKEATSKENFDLWDEPIQSELKSMSDHNVWEIVERKPGMNVIPLMWKFTIKDDNRRKARLVAVGCCDKEKYDAEDSAAPTPSKATVRWLLTLAQKNNWDIRQLDVKTAFLHGPIDRLKYVGIPEGMDLDSKKYALKLNKALYGLVTASKRWNSTFDEFITECGFVRSAREPCLYSKVENGLITIVLLYVDDILITGSDSIGVNTICKQLENKFDIKYLGFPKKFLGLEIEKLSDGSLFLHQATYITNMLKEFNMSDSNCKPTPMIPIANHRILSVSNEEKTFPYKKAIGALLYLANNTRLDITFSVGYLARFQANPSDIHWVLLKRIFRYLKGTKNFGILIKCSDDKFDAYVDADHAADSSRKSTTGFVIRMFGCPVAWTSRLQSCIAESTGEAEYMAICEAVRDILFLTRLTEEVMGPVKYPITVHEDNIAALRKCSSTTGKSRLKHIELIYFKVREYVQNGLIKVKKIDTKNQLADILTKPLLENDFRKFFEKLMSENPKTTANCLKN